MHVVSKSSVSGYYYGTQIDLRENGSTYIVNLLKQWKENDIAVNLLWYKNELFSLVFVLKEK